MKHNIKVLFISGLVFLVLVLVSAASADAQTPEDYSERASEASNNGKHDEAVTLYTKAIELKPSESLYSLRASEYEELGKLDLALGDRNKVIELKPYSLDKALERRGKLYVHMGKYDLAVADYTKELSISPRRARIYNYRSEAYLIMGKPDLAYADFVSFVNSGNTSDGILANAIFVAYLSLRKSGKAAEAKKFIDEAAPQFDQSRFEAKIARFLKGDLTNAQLISDPNGDPGWAHFYVGEMLLLSSDGAAAAEHFQFVRDKGTKYTFGYDLAVVELSRMPATKSVFRRNAEMFVTNGRQLRDSGDFNGAIASYTRAIELDPTYADAYFGRAVIYDWIHKYDLALADWDAVLKLAPNDYPGYYNRVNTRLALGDNAGALTDANKLISLRPELTSSYFGHAQVLIRQLKFELAIADYNKAISLDPKNPLYVQRRAFAQFANGQNSDAHKDAVAALSMDITNKDDMGMGTLVIGYLALEKLGKRPEADALIKNWVTVLKAKEWSTGIVNYINGVETAEQLLARADTNAKLTRFHTYIGEVLLAKGQTAAAKPHFIWVNKNGDKNTDEYSLVSREIVRLGLPRSK